ncbi:unnamed protein product [Brachionus calyciflorus]|uniref:Uncharacterized protein n=1 Tax=Brachionus calyciflorus TaxID=104777 RepID=A0A813WT71_9BILA|nr:unnamed protein product [Brachionus calyciflorus]
MVNLKKYIVISHPNLFTLKKEEVSAGVKYHRAFQGPKPDTRKKLYVTKDSTFGSYKELYLSDDITNDVYMKRIVVMLIIYKKKKQKIDVIKQNISSFEEELEYGSDESSDDGVDSDDDAENNKGIPSALNELVQHSSNLLLHKIVLDVMAI